MIGNYISINCKTAGPIQIGPAGAWLKTTTPISASGAGQLSFLTSLKNNTFCQLRAASPSKDDTNGVVTVEFLEQYGFNPNNVTVDFSQYVTKTVFDALTNDIFGSTSYPEDAETLVNRIIILEREVSQFDASTDELEKTITSLSTSIGINAGAIVELNKRIDNLSLDPFEGAVLFIAGGAVTG